MRAQKPMNDRGMDEALRLISRDLGQRHPGVEFFLRRPDDRRERSTPQVARTSRAHVAPPVRRAA